MKTLQERNREANRKYFAKMSDEERKAFYRARYYKHKERYNAQSSQWAKDNREKSQASSHNAAVRKNYPEIYTTSDIDNSTLTDWLITNRDTPCVYCSQPGVSIDHRVPLSKGGTHTWGNIQLTCGICNNAKHDLLEEEFLVWVKRVVNTV